MALEPADSLPHTWPPSRHLHSSSSVRYPAALRTSIMNRTQRFAYVSVFPCPRTRFVTYLTKHYSVGTDRPNSGARREPTAHESDRRSGVSSQDHGFAGGRGDGESVCSHSPVVRIHGSRWTFSFDLRGHTSSTPIWNRWRACRRCASWASLSARRATGDRMESRNLRSGAAKASSLE